MRAARSTQYPTDSEIRAGVERELNHTPEVGTPRIVISVEDGEVVLSGVAASYQEKSAAVTAALRVRGIEAILDDIVVESINRKR